MFGALQNWWDKQCNRCNKFRWANCVQPERAASTEFAFTQYTNWTHETPLRHNSLPRRVFGNLRSERNEYEVLEEIALKRLLKEHGLYNKHQTIQQRRRLKYLLALEQRANLLLLHGEGRAQVSSLLRDTDRPTCSIELHSIPIAPEHGMTTTSNEQYASIASPDLRRGSSLSALATSSPSDTNSRYDEKTISLPTIMHEAARDTVKSRCLKTVSWKNSASSAASTILETAV